MSDVDKLSIGCRTLTGYNDGMKFYEFDESPMRFEYDVDYMCGYRLGSARRTDKLFSEFNSFIGRTICMAFGLSPDELNEKLSGNEQE